MPDVQLNVRHAFTSRFMAGGSKSNAFSAFSLKRAKTDERPKVSSQLKYKGDHILTRSGHRGALVLGRMVKGHPVKPKVIGGGQPQPQPQPPQHQVAPQLGVPPQQLPPVPQGAPPPLPPPTFGEKLSGLQKQIDGM